MNNFKKHLKYFDRIIKTDITDVVQLERIDSLKKHGYVIMEDFIKPERLGEMQADYRSVLEKECKFELPCLAQTKIDEDGHSDIIDNYFRFHPQDLSLRGLTFDQEDVVDYESVLAKFKPSSLKTSLTDLPNFIGIWLDKELLEIIEGYLGMKPYLVEAYVKRNFPAKYRVMNHFWHRDTNNPDYVVKAFVFLSDCTITTGPHEYIAGSIEDLRLSGKPYFADEEVDALYPSGSPERVKSVVKAGTVIIEDTRGLHRAVTPEEGFRDLGFAVFVPVSQFSKFKSAIRGNARRYYEIGLEKYSKLTEWQKSYIP
jgi:hypothetical protein